MSLQETPSAEMLKNLLAQAQQEQQDEAIILRLQVILFFVEHHCSISETCQAFRISRSTFHRWMERFDPHDIQSLSDGSHIPMSLRQPTVEPQVIEKIRQYRIKSKHIGKEKIAELLASEHQIIISASTVGRVIERECFYFADTPFHWKKRLAVQQEPASVQKIIEDKKEGDALTPSADTTTATRAEWPESSMMTFSFSVPFKVAYWQQIRRFIIFSSIIANLVLLSVIFGHSLMESFSVAETATQAPMYEQMPMTPAAHAAAEPSFYSKQ